MTQAELDAILAQHKLCLDGDFMRESLPMVIASLNIAYESFVVAFYADGYTAKFHYTRAIRDLHKAAAVLGFDLVPRQPAPAPVAVEAQPEAVL